MSPQKNSIVRLKFLEPLVAVVFWVLMMLSPLLFGKHDGSIDWQHISKVWISFVPYMVLFLLNRLVFLPRFFFRGKQWHFLISNLLLIFALSVLVHFCPPLSPEPLPLSARQEMPAQGPPADGLQHEGPPTHRPPGDRPLGDRPPGEGPIGEGPIGDGPMVDDLPAEGPGLRGDRQGPHPGGTPPKLPPSVIFVIISVLIIGFDTGLMVSVEWARSEQLRVQAEKESMESQLAFLQNQVSPHFFMNTLNNIHSQIDIDTAEAKDSIIKLSRLMRHLLYDSQVEKIPLKKEVDFIQDYVELMRLRYSEKVKIDLHIADLAPEKSIPPLLFTSFVENAFKHGISYQEDSFIDISLTGRGGQLSFVVRNSNPKMKKGDGPSGIGIVNARKRLDLLFGDSYRLDIDDAKDTFTVSLNIPV